jgi:HNH endonuclease
MSTKTHDEKGRKLILRLEMSKEIDPETECWIWKGGKTKAGYGGLRIGTEVLYVHRLSAQLHLGFDPAAGLYVLHHCDVRACFNPAHLFVGTHTDNMRDAARKGRLGRGKLNREKVAEIKRLLGEGWTHADLARRYGVSAATISQIATGKIWKDV